MSVRVKRFSVQYNATDREMACINSLPHRGCSTRPATMMGFFFPVMALSKSQRVNGHFTLTLARRAHMTTTIATLRLRVADAVRCGLIREVEANHWVAVDYAVRNMTCEQYVRLCGRHNKEAFLPQCCGSFADYFERYPRLGAGILQNRGPSKGVGSKGKKNTPRGFFGGLEEPSVAEEIEHRVDGEVASQSAPAVHPPTPAKPAPIPERAVEAQKGIIPALPAGLLALADALAEDKPEPVAAPAQPARADPPAPPAPKAAQPRPPTTPSPSISRPWHPEGPPPTEHDVAQAMRAVEGADVAHHRVDSARRAWAAAKVTAEELGWAVATYRRPKRGEAQKPLAALFGLLRRRRRELARATGAPLDRVLWPDVRRVELDHLQPQGGDCPGVLLVKRVALHLQGGGALPGPDRARDAGTSVAQGAPQIFLEGTGKAAVPWPHGAAPAPATDAPR